MEKQRMKILMIPPASAGMVNGGVRMQVLKTAEALRNQGLDVQLFNPLELWNPADFDLVHLFQAGHEMLSLSNLIPTQSVPVVLSPVLFSRHPAERMRRWLWFESLFLSRLGGATTELMVKKMVCERADLLLPNTPAEAAWIQSAFGIASTRIQWIPNGVDRRFAEADPRLFEEKTGLQGITLFVGHVVSERKNLLRVIEQYRAADMVPKTEGLAPMTEGVTSKSVPPPPLVLIGQTEGGGAYGEACRQAIERNPDVIALGPMDAEGPMLASAYASARVFLLPSMFETPGIAAMEAAVAGATPVITAYGGTKDVFGDDAIYVEPSDTKGILEAVARAHQQWETHSERGGTWSGAQRYSWDVVAQKTLEAYRNL